MRAAKSGYSRIRESMRRNEQDVLDMLRRNGGHDPLIVSVATSKAMRRLQDAGMIRWHRPRNRWTGYWIVKPYARPVTRLAK